MVCSAAEKYKKAKFPKGVFLSSSRAAGCGSKGWLGVQESCVHAPRCPGHTVALKARPLLKFQSCRDDYSSIRNIKKYSSPSIFCPVIWPTGTLGNGQWSQVKTELGYFQPESQSSGAPPSSPTPSLPGFPPLWNGLSNSACFLGLLWGCIRGCEWTLGSVFDPWYVLDKRWLQE